jgi:hypothetical protein
MGQPPLWSFGLLPQLFMEAAQQNPLHKEYKSIQDEITAQEIRASRPPRGQVGVSDDERTE